MENKLFEYIYEINNYATETELTYLESPLDTTSKPPMYLEEDYLQRYVFPRIYELCFDNTE
ncbi:MAG: hypothetical protein LBE13_14930, partial [Bacteroidales bacterium]|nr:hypothetical protein [Bacteroidales bacterium]